MNTLRVLYTALVCLVISLCLLELPASAFNMGLTPAKILEHLNPGQEKTVVYSLTNGSTSENLRIQVLVSDWSMSDEGKLATPGVGSYEFSASNWVEISPMEFVVKPRQTQLVRATYKVPADAKPGDHLTALLFRQRVIVPPLRERSMGQLVPQGLIGSLAYIAVQPEEKKFDLKSMKYLPAEGQEPAQIQFTILNQGNVHVNPTGNLEILDAEKHSVFSTGLPDLPATLRGMIGVREIPIDVQLAPGTYEAILNVRVDNVGDAQCGRHNFTVVAKPLAIIKEAPAAATTKPGAFKPTLPAAVKTSGAKTPAPPPAKKSGSTAPASAAKKPVSSTKAPTASPAKPH